MVEIFVIPFRQHNVNVGVSSYRESKSWFSMAHASFFSLLAVLIVAIDQAAPVLSQETQQVMGTIGTEDAFQTFNDNATHCNCVGCNLAAWDWPTTQRDTGDTFTCGQRIMWLQTEMSLSEVEACLHVAKDEYPNECGLCDPSSCVRPKPGRCGGCSGCMQAWEDDAGGRTCGAWITHLQTNINFTFNELRYEFEACHEVAERFPDQCGSCDPNVCQMPESIVGNDTDNHKDMNISTTLPSSMSPSNGRCGFGPFIGCTFEQNQLLPPNYIKPEYISRPLQPTIGGTGGNITVSRATGLNTGTSSEEQHVKHRRSNGRPIPTSKWWTNMIGPSSPGPAGETTTEPAFPVFSHPYRISFNENSDFGIHVTYSADYRTFIPANTSNGVPKGYFHGSPSDWVFSSPTFVERPKVEILDWDDAGLGFSVEITPANALRKKMTTDVVVGMPFVTARYQNMTPRLSTTHAIISINEGKMDVAVSPQKSTKFVIENNGGQRWVVYSSKPISFRRSSSYLTSTESFDDVIIRIVRLPDEAPDTVFDPFATCIVTGGVLELIDSSTYAFDWEAQGDCSNGLIHLGFLHQAEVLDKNTVNAVQNVRLSSATRGIMQAFSTPAGKEMRWVLVESEDIPINGFFPPRRPNLSLIDAFGVRSILRDEIGEDFFLDGTSYYFNGKVAQKYANLCLLASEPDMNTDDSLLKTCTAKLKRAMDVFLSNKMAFPLVYDEVYRGIVSSGGFVVKNNPLGVDFGNTVYNDHHFHWGYWIYTGAVLRKLDPTWKRMNELDAIVNLLIRDTMNSDSSLDHEFPTWRHFDWFSGHSSSHGLVPFMDGKDQESTSEEMNFHYSIYLWGKVGGIEELENLGKLCMKICARSVGQYLLMEDGNVVHPKIVKNKVVGIFFENKVDYATWFGANLEYIHGIQMIPVSPVNEIFRSDAFVRQEWESVIQHIDMVVSPESYREDPWQSLLYCNYAVIDAVAAMGNLSDATMDGSLSRSWALYYASTRLSAENITRRDIEGNKSQDGEVLPQNKSQVVDVLGITDEVDGSFAIVAQPLQPLLYAVSGFLLWVVMLCHTSG